MTTSTPTTVRLSSPRPSSAARAVLAVGAGLSAVAFAIAVVGLIVDPTVLTGAPAWMKPAKFSFSIAVYLLTLRWILSYVRGHDRLLAVLSTVITVALVAEIALIEMQVLRGTTSHYNEVHPLRCRGPLLDGRHHLDRADRDHRRRRAGPDAARPRPGIGGGAPLGHRHLRARHARCPHDDLQQGMERLRRTHRRGGGWRGGDAHHRLEPRARRPAHRTLHRAARPAAAAAARLGAAAVGRTWTRRPAPACSPWRGRPTPRSCCSSPGRRFAGRASFAPTARPWRSSPPSRDSRRWPRSRCCGEAVGDPRWLGSDGAGTFPTVPR